MNNEFEKKKKLPKKYQHKNRLFEKEKNYLF